MAATNYLRPLTWFGFTPNGESGDEVYGVCIFCGKLNKFYLNRVTGQWSCKGGDCQRSGNYYSFLKQWWEFVAEAHGPNTSGFDGRWGDFAEERGIDVPILTSAGIVCDGRRFAIPIRNESGAIVSFKFYVPGGKLMQLPGSELQLYGQENLKVETKEVYLCEGEWDAIALTALRGGCSYNRRSNGDNPGTVGEVLQPLGGTNSSAVLGVPGAGTFKNEWAAALSGRNAVICYDNDSYGKAGTEKVRSKLDGVAKSISSIVWPADKPNKYDIRDAYREGVSFETIQSWIVELVSPNGKHKYVDLPPKLILIEEPNTAIVAADKPEAENQPVVKAVHASDTSYNSGKGQKPPFQTVLDAYAKHLFMTEDYEWAIRCAYAVVMSQQMRGDPLWLYLVAPPSSGKTIVLQSFSDAPGCVLKSTLTAHSLVSGFRLPDGRDPSLIPQLDGKTFILKDFTEVLNINRTMRDEIYSVLRGAYDGLVEKSFGNGITRRYEPHFSMLAGVTQAVFAERSASLGERFLMLHVIKGNDRQDDETISRALDNVGLDETIRTQLCETATDYLARCFSPEELLAAETSSSREFHTRLVALAQLVAMLRGQVEKDFRGEMILYRPQIEVGARLAKQLKKMAVALALLEDPIGINSRVYKIICRIAFDTCIGFNLDILQALAGGGRMSTIELADFCEMPYSTIRDRISDLEMLGVLNKVKDTNPVGTGAPIFYYSLSENCARCLKIVRDSDSGFDSMPLGLAYVKYRKK